ncbi:MAG: protein-disulfide reductase DsbD family protein [Melioribacteraceae bacterium]|nr:protein-disulfide reductase DsbD family protein [Melioribacteraceae bacterium]
MKLFQVFFLVSTLFINVLNSQTVRTDYVESELISEVESIQPGEPFWVALRLKMDEHWHTYWRNAGDAGLATKINWTLPDGFSASEIHWPYPQKIYLEDMANYGYEGETFLLTKITPPPKINLEEITIEAEGKWLVCKIECLPGEANYKLTLPVKNETPKTVEKWQQAFAETRFKFPLENSDWEIAGTKNENNVIINLTPSAEDLSIEKIEFYPFEGGIYQNAADQNFTKTKDGYELTIPFGDFQVTDPDSLEGNLSFELWLAG